MEATTKEPKYTVHSVNFDHEPQVFDTFDKACNACRKRGFEAAITDGLGETIGTWSPVKGLRMVPNKYSA